MSNKTFVPSASDVSRRWHLIDAKGQVLGRLASQVAGHLTGKKKAIYTPSVDCGDFVVVLNAELIRLTGNSKPVQKIDFRHSGYPGGHTITPYSEFLKKNPERAIELAISGMLPKNRLRSRRMARLKVYKGDKHPHAGQLAAPKVSAEVAS